MNPISCSITACLAQLGIGFWELLIALAILPAAGICLGIVAMVVWLLVKPWKRTPRDRS